MNSKLIKARQLNVFLTFVTAYYSFDSCIYVLYLPHPNEIYRSNLRGAIEKYGLQKIQERKGREERSL